MYPNPPICNKCKATPAPSDPRTCSYCSALASMETLTRQVGRLQSPSPAVSSSEVEADAEATPRPDRGNGSSQNPSSQIDPAQAIAEVEAEILAGMRAELLRIHERVKARIADGKVSAAEGAYLLDVHDRLYRELEEGVKRRFGATRERERRSLSG
ncbi:hypothetical protein BJX61DRAFT_542159 [Aspergillus egyptiacus]|nr:hypothetical protein BJX61DRAFT_542159 [Aspergillus egyptiacus]